MTLQRDANKAQVAKSLSTAAFILERTADSFASIQEINGLPEALYTFGKTIPILPIFLKSLESSILNGENELEEKYATAYQFAELCQKEAKYFDAIFDAIASTDRYSNKQEKYLIVAENWGRRPIETVWKDLLLRAIGFAAEFEIDDEIKPSLQAAFDEMVKVNPSLAEEEKKGVVITNHGDGTQFYHGGKGNQNHCTGGIQCTGDGYVIHMKTE
ncbi:hypothetical protein Trisim1_002241 [Trichoderma cf. simile WF8]